MLRTDVKSFYESIDHHLLIERLAVYIKDRFILNLLWQSMSRCVDCGGVFRDIRRGIPRGSPLSPLLGAFFLAELDNCFDHTDVYYVRYMDDVLIMTRTRWSLRRNVARLNRIFNLLKIEKHPDKTFIGRIDKGFDFLGYRFGGGTLALAQSTWNNFRAHLHRLYEQKRTAPEGAAALDAYVTRWVRWTTAGLNGLTVRVTFPTAYAEASQPDTE